MVQFSAGRVVKMLLGVLLFTSSFHCSANLEQTLAYIDRLLENNKKVAILMVDMQEQFSQYFSGPPQIKDQIIGDQMTLVDKMAGSDGVFFVDINLIPQKYGNTVPVLLSRMKKNKNYSLVLKDYDSAFYSSTQVMTVDESGSQKEMQIIDGNLQHFLDKNGIQDVVITGCFDGSCVFATAMDAMDALDAGYNVMVDREMNIVLDGRSDGITKLPSESLARRRERWNDLQVKWAAREGKKSDFVLISTTRYDSCQVD